MVVTQVTEANQVTVVTPAIVEIMVTVVTLVANTTIIAVVVTMPIRGIPDKSTLNFPMRNMTNPEIKNMTKAKMILLVLTLTSIADLLDLGLVTTK